MATSKPKLRVPVGPPPSGIHIRNASPPSARCRPDACESAGDGEASPADTYREPAGVTRGELEALRLDVNANGVELGNLDQELGRLSRRTATESRYALGFALGVILALIGLLASDCSAQHYQGAEVERGDDVLAARSCVGEVGWGDVPNFYPACAAVIGVHARRARRAGKTLGQMTVAYSTAMRSARRPWVARLWLRSSSPPHWPASASWHLRRRAFRRVLEHVRMVLRGDYGDPFEDRAEVLHYAAAGVPPPRRFEQLDCFDVSLPGGPRRVQCFHERVS